MVSAPSFKSKYSKQEEEQSQKVNISGGYWFIWGHHGLSSGLFPQSLPGRSYLCSCSSTATPLSTWHCVLEVEEQCNENAYKTCLVLNFCWANLCTFHSLWRSEEKFEFFAKKQRKCEENFTNKNHMINLYFIVVN